MYRVIESNLKDFDSQSLLVLHCGRNDDTSRPFIFETGWVLIAILLKKAACVCINNLNLINNAPFIVLYERVVEAVSQVKSSS